MKTLLDFTNTVEKLMKKKFKILRKTYKLPSSFDLYLEGPNVIFRSKTIEYQIVAYKFKDGSSNNYTDILGYCSLGFTLSLFNKDSEMVAKLEKAIEFAYKIANANIIQSTFAPYLWLK